jgi:LPXTG-motif cell wall-anchored protein
MITNVRLLPAVAALVLVVAPSAHASPRVGLSGQLTGAVMDQPQVPDVPTEHDLSGRGSTNLGPTVVHGAVSGTGNIAQGTCSGRLELEAPGGTLTLKVGSAPLGPFQECPTALTWRVTASTGALAGSAGRGTMRLITGNGHFRLRFDGPGTPPPALPSTGAATWAAWAGLAALLAGAGARRLRGA